MGIGRDVPERERGSGSGQVYGHGGDWIGIEIQFLQARTDGEMTRGGGGGGGGGGRRTGRYGS